MGTTRNGDSGLSWLDQQFQLAMMEARAENAQQPSEELEDSVYEDEEVMELDYNEDGGSDLQPDHPTQDPDPDQPLGQLLDIAAALIASTSFLRKRNRQHSWRMC